MKKSAGLFQYKHPALLGRILEGVFPSWGQWIRNESWTDELTRVFNLKAARVLIPRWLSQAGTDFYMAFADIDYFKSINDCHSHDAGDFVLVAFAAVAYRFFPDRVFRIGGEEFLWCLNGTEKCALGRAEEFRQAVEREVAPAANRLLAEHNVGGRRLRPDLLRYPITVSQGLAQAGKSALTFQKLKTGADAALYLAKDLGRNAVVFRSKMVSQGRPPTQYTRLLVKALHQLARQKGFHCWWEMREGLEEKEEQKMIRLAWKETGEMKLAGLKPSP